MLKNYTHCKYRVAQCHRCSKKWENRKLRIEKIRKIGNFVLKNRRKIGKSIVLSSTKIVSLHPIRVVIKKGYESSASTFAGLFRSTFAA